MTRMPFSRATLDELALADEAFRTGLGEPAGEDDETADPLGGALGDDVEHARGRDRDDGEVDLPRDVREACGSAGTPSTSSASRWTTWRAPVNPAARMFDRRR